MRVFTANRALAIGILLALVITVALQLAGLVG